MQRRLPMFQKNGPRYHSIYGAESPELKLKNTCEKLNSPEIMTHYLKTIHTPDCEQFHVGTTFLCIELYPPAAVQKEAGINSNLRGIKH